MAKVIIFMIAASYFHQVTYGHPADLGEALTRNIRKSFDVDLNNHMKTVQEIHAPLVAALTNKTCDYTTEEGNVESSSDRIRQCVKFTKAVGSLEGLVLHIYDLAGNYTRETLAATENVTICLQKEDLISVTLCLLEEENFYSDHMRVLDDDLRETIIHARYAESDIIESFNGCFRTNAINLQEISRLHAEKCKTKLAT